jgi:hypothetical protein
MKIKFVYHRKRSVFPLQRPAVNKLVYINKYSTMCGQNDKSFDVKAVNNRLEFITKLMHNFIYSIIILHHDP